MEANKNNSTFKKILFVGIVILLTLPMLQQTTGFFEPEPLKGDFVVLEKPTLTSENWWSGEFQEEYEGYMNQNIGFRPFFVRTYNQMQFSLFNQAKADRKSTRLNSSHVRISYAVFCLKKKKKKKNKKN